MTPWGNVETASDQRLSPAQLYQLRQDAVMRRRGGAGLYGMNAFDPNAFMQAFSAGAGAITAGGASALVQRIEVKSEFTPTYTYDANAPAGTPPAQSKSSNWLLARAKPQVVVYGPNGAVLYDYHPYGVPVPEKYVWPLVGAAAAGGAIGGYFLVKGLFATFKPRPRMQNPRRRRRQAARRARRRSR